MSFQHTFVACEASSSGIPWRDHLLRKHHSLLQRVSSNFFSEAPQKLWNYQFLWLFDKLTIVSKNYQRAQSGCFHQNTTRIGHLKVQGACDIHGEAIFLDWITMKTRHWLLKIHHCLMYSLLLYFGKKQMFRCSKKKWWNPNSQRVPYPLEN